MTWIAYAKQNNEYKSLEVALAKKKSKNKNQIFEEKVFQIFLHGEKEDFEKYSLNLEYVELNFPILNNYSTEKCQSCPRATVVRPKRAPLHCFLLLVLCYI
jgi:hypothetical protein